MPWGKHAIIAGALLIIAIVSLFVAGPRLPDGMDRDSGQPGVSVQRGTSIGDQAIDVSFTTVNGQRLRLSDFEGKQALIVNAWAGWCQFCIQEMLLLQQQAGTHDGATVIFAHRTRTESRDIAREYLSRFRRERGTAITVPVVWDPEDVFYQTYFRFGMPVTLFIDRHGYVIDKKIGPLTDEELRHKIGGMLP